MGIRKPVIDRTPSAAGPCVLGLCPLGLCLLGLCLLALVVVAGVFWSNRMSAGSSAGPASPARDQGIVTHLVDGDTLDVRVTGVVLRVRLLNVDTPETKKPNTPVQCMGPEASDRLAELAPIGSTVELNYDVERVDRFGRTLAMVTTEAGVNVSETLAAEGLGVAVRIGQNGAGYARVRAAEKQAEKLRLGLFSVACGDR